MKEIGKKYLGHILLAAFFVFALYSNVRLIIRNQTINKRLADAKTETQKAEYENKKLELLIKYYQTPSYQEVEARRRLNMKKPDEIALNIKGSPASADDQSQSISDSAYVDQKPVPAQPESNISRWWKYFFN